MESEAMEAFFDCWMQGLLCLAFGCPWWLVEA